MAKNNEVLVQITAPHFCAGLVAKNGRVVMAAPILMWMMGRDGFDVNRICKKRNWQWWVVR